MTGIVFHDEMVKRMAKSTVNPDAQILETAYETGRKQGEAETVTAVLEIIDTAILDYKTDVELAIKKNDLMQATERQSHVHALKSIKAQIATMEGGEQE